MADKVSTIFEASTAPLWLTTHNGELNMPNTLSNKLKHLFADYQRHLLEGEAASFDYGLFKKEVWNYFDQCDQVTIENLFRRFCAIWSIFYQRKEFLRASQFWDLPITFAHEWEEQSGGKVLHKGTPYYCKAMSLLKAGNIDTSFLFFHQAAEEDRRWPSNATRQTPAWSFVTLNVNNERQAAFEMVREACDWLELYLNAYCSNREGRISLESLRTNVLAPSRFDETTFSFTHSVFHMKDLLSLSPRIRCSQFAAQVELDILFNLARIAEVWMRDKQQNKRLTFSPLLKAFFQAQRWRWLSAPEYSALKEPDFDRMLIALLDRNRETLKRIYLPSESDLLILFVLRNKVGHAPSTSCVVQNRFPDLVERALFGLFIIAEKLFP